jgi:hypothetical protein
MTVHAMEEMAEDDLDILDIEQAGMTGRVVRREKDDPRGTKYVVEGFATDVLPSPRTSYAMPKRG